MDDDVPLATLASTVPAPIYQQATGSSYSQSRLQPQATGSSTSRNVLAPTTSVFPQPTGSSFGLQGTIFPQATGVSAGGVTPTASSSNSNSTFISILTGFEQLEQLLLSSMIMMLLIPRTS